MTCADLTINPLQNLLSRFGLKIIFEQDATDARQWLLDHQLIDENEQPTWQVRK